jgi:hypothetical protein
MNLFFLDIDPKKCAEYHCDKHVVKMILEIVQMLYCAHHAVKSDLPPGAYKQAHLNHPTCIWIRTNLYNYTYAGQVGLELAKEYTYRYNKIHSCQKHVEWLIINVPKFEKVSYVKTPTFSTFDGVVQVPLAMPEDCMLMDTVKSYRRYYLIHKKRFAKWTTRKVPDWFCYINVFN